MIETVERFVAKMLTGIGRYWLWIVSGLVVFHAALLLWKRKRRPTTTSVERFPRLSAIDRIMARQKRPIYENSLALDTFCERFRLFAASELHLYYDLKLIRLFVAGLAASRLTIMQGISGTGKTSLAYAFGKFIRNDTVIIPVQPSWRDRSDMLGYYNEFSRRFTESDLLVKMYEAGYSKDVYIAVLDEMNIARIEYYFAEFLSVLELPSPDEWKIGIISDHRPHDPAHIEGGRIRLPVNMWYVGTANNDDSTFAVSDKVYDRAMVIDINGKAKPFEAPRATPVHVTAEYLLSLFEKAQADAPLSTHSLRRIDELDQYLIEHLHITFGNRISHQLRLFVPAYVACGGEEWEAIDYVLCKKVLRKLEGLGISALRMELDAFSEFLIQTFGDGRMPECQAYTHRLKQMNQ